MSVKLNNNASVKQSTTAIQTEIRFPQTNSASSTACVPESDMQQVTMNHKKLLIISAVLLFSVVILCSINVQMRKEIGMIEKQHDFEIASLNKVHAAEIKVEQEKGIYSRHIQPLFDWILNSSLEAEVESGPVSAKLKVNPND